MREKVFDDRRSPLDRRAGPSDSTQAFRTAGYEPGVLRNRFPTVGPDSTLWEAKRGPLFHFINNSEHESYSQFFQDMWILHKTSQKRRGFFVEFGATDGIYLSNTFQLEKGLRLDGHSRGA